jgi:hypothetical protein
MTELIGHISVGACLDAREVASFLPIYKQLLTQAPLAVLNFPSSYPHQAAVREKILDWLASQ